MNVILSLILGCIVPVVGTFIVPASLHFNADERHIITLTDERRDADSLLNYLASTDLRVAWRAAIGIGNIGDTSVRAALIERFRSESRDSIADAESFALGLLGPDRTTYNTLVETSNNHPTLERLNAIARTAPKDDSSSAPEIVHRLLTGKKIDNRIAAEAYIAFILRHEACQNLWNDEGTLGGDNDPHVRWRAAYAFGRAGDSTDLSGRFSLLNDLLLDQGSADVRMFGALALGKLHDRRALLALARAYRGEEDWRVRVNMLRALQGFPRFDTLMLQTAQVAISSAEQDSATSMQVGRAAGDLIEHCVISGALTNADSATLRAWLDGFAGQADNGNEEVPPIVASHLTLPAVQLGTPSRLDAIQYYFGFRDAYIRTEALHAAATILDTNFFKSILLSVGAFSSVEQIESLLTLDSMWQHRSQNARFLKSIETDHLADLYRGLLLHLSDVVQDNAVDATTLALLQDTSILNTATRKAEATPLIEQYISRFCNGRMRDALLASVEVDGWLQDASQTADSALHCAYDSANSWHDKEIMDTIAPILRRIEGANARIPLPLPIVSSIDWNEIESLPPKMVINFSDGTLVLNLLTNEAPLTVWNMVQLAREQWFTGNIVHRIVPNFVIQSGDPSGTGWGSPGYTIRSEITPRSYDRAGLAGMASSGKDTEGSQWFITQCPTPHLDTHYTIWAEVTDGLDVAFHRSVGDRISSVFSFH